MTSLLPCASLECKSSQDVLSNSHSLQAFYFQIWQNSQSVLSLRGALTIFLLKGRLWGERGEHRREKSS